MAETKNKNKPIPSLSGYGGVRALQKNLERSTTIAANRGRCLLVAVYGEY